MTNPEEIQPATETGFVSPDPAVGEDENPPLPENHNPSEEGITVDGDIDESVADDADGTEDDDDAEATQV